MAYSRRLSEEHKRKISIGVRRAWAKIPIDPNGELTLNVNYDENNNQNFKVYLDDGTEIKR